MKHDLTLNKLDDAGFWGQNPILTRFFLKKYTNNDTPLFIQTGFWECNDQSFASVCI